MPLGVIGSSKEKLEPYWITIYGSRTDVANPNGYEADQDITVDSQGNVYQIGYAQGSPSYAANPTSAIALIKYNSMGVMQYQKEITYSVATETYGHGVRVDSSDNVYIQATTSSGSYPNFIDIHLLMKLDSTGNILWEKRFGGASTPDSYSSFHDQGLDVDPSGNMYVVAQKNADSYYYVNKLTASGSVSQQFYLTHANQGYFDNIAVDTSGNMYFHGDFADGGSFSNAYALATKISSSGSVEWARYLNNDTTQYSIGTSLDVDSSGNVYLCGYLSPDSGQSGVLRGFIAKLNSSGTTLWKRKIDNSLFRNIVVSPSGNIYASGWENSTGSSRGYVVKYSNSGTLQWQRNMLGMGSLGYQMAVDSSENFYLTGSYFNSYSGMVIAKLPGDGSFTGTHGEGSYQFVYSAASLTETSLPESFSSTSVSKTNTSISITNSAVSVANPNIEHERVNVK